MSIIHCVHHFVTPRSVAHLNPLKLHFFLIAQASEHKIMHSMFFNLKSEGQNVGFMIAHQMA